MRKLRGLAMPRVLSGFAEVKLSDEQWQQCQQEYFTEVKEASTAEGYWNDVTMFFVRAHKSGQATALFTIE